MPEEDPLINTIQPESDRRSRPVVLLLLDGWAVAPATEVNAITSAKTPFFLSLIREYPVALLNPGQKSLNARYLTIGTGQEFNDENSTTDLTLTSVIAAANLTQIKIAETERFAALTHFFNGQAENKLAGEDWKIISSLSGHETVGPTLVFKRTVKAIIKTIEEEKLVDFIVAAIPYLDLIASSGDLAVVKKAVTDLDKNLKKIFTAVEAKNGILIISAAGGNVEKMHDLLTELPDTGITASPVPVLIVGADFKGKTIGLIEPFNNDLSLLAPAGTLADLAPTVLHILGLTPPPEMTGHSLL